MNTLEEVTNPNQTKKRGRPKTDKSQEEIKVKKREYAQKYYQTHKAKMDASARVAREKQRQLIAFARQMRQNDTGAVIAN